MANAVESKCGIICSQCSYKEQFNCPGCLESKGKMAWGECSLAKCCFEKDLEHCGHCNDFVCTQLHDFAFDAEHGDNGQRIENLMRWK